MPFYGIENRSWETQVFVAMAVISGALFVYHVWRAIFVYKALAFFMLPLVSLSLLYANIALSLGATIRTKGSAAIIGEVLRAVVVPGLGIACFEMTYLLHQKRVVRVCGIAFDEGGSTIMWWGIFVVWGMRVAAVGLFIITVVSLRLQEANTEAESEGYIALRKDRSGFFIMAKTVPTALIFLGFWVAIQLRKYGLIFALDQHSSPIMWRYVILGTVCFTVGEIFDQVHIYRVTSNAGALALLCGATLLCRPVLADLQQATNFEDFLHKADVDYAQRRRSGSYLTTLRELPATIVNTEVELTGQKIQDENTVSEIRVAPVVSTEEQST